MSDSSRADRILREFRENGFARATFEGHEAERALALARRFFTMPLSDRLQAAAFTTSGVLGYYPSEGEAAALLAQHGIVVPTFAGRRARGYCSFDYIANEQVLQTSTLLTENRWPSDASFRTEACGVYEVLSAFMKSLSAGILAELEAQGRLKHIPRAAFDCECCSIMRLLRYATQEEESESKPHTDYEFVSLILADRSGLEVCAPDGTWHMPGADCNAALLPGDMLEVASGGWIQSALHRVRFGKAERYSVIFFQGLGLSQRIVYSSDSNFVESTFGTHLSAMLVRGAPHLVSSIERWEEALGVKIPAKNPFRESKGGGLY